MSSRHVVTVLVPAAVLLLLLAGQASAQCNGGQLQAGTRPQLAMLQQRATLPQLGLTQTALQSQYPLQLYAAQSPVQQYALQQYALRQYALQQYALQQQNAMMAAALQQQQNAMTAAALQQQQNAALAALLQQQQQNAALAALVQQQNAAPVQLIAR